jgi:uncharacterized membrane protein (DUF2068 family)
LVQHWEFYLGWLFFFGGIIIFPGLPYISGSMLISVGIFFLVLGILGFFVGRGLQRIQKWARIVTIILIGINVMMSVYDFIKGDLFEILDIVLSLIIIIYLLFSKEVKKAFT